MIISELRHPEYLTSSDDWYKWRLAYKGGRPFIDQYTQMFSSRETSSDFEMRKLVTYCPAFAKAALNEVKNSIFQRVVDITRKGGPITYQEAVLGRRGGVDRRGSSMNNYVGRHILPDLLTIGKIGVFVDRERVNGKTLNETRGKTPYIYAYRAEDILAWTLSQNSPSEFTEVLLRDVVEKKFEQTNLVCDVIERFRRVYIGENGRVVVEFYNADGKLEESFQLGLKKIPFVLFQLTGSLMEDVADYQIALLNLGSSDMNYVLRANFPFYVEKASPRDMLPSLMPGTGGTSGTETAARTAGPREIQVGAITGRQYTDVAPEFINPSAEPLKASIEKQEQLKNEIRLLVNLSLSNVRPKMASAESKSLDMAGLESGLSYIGIELEHGERQIAEHWAAYEGSSDIPTINYPARYELQDNEDRRRDVETLTKHAPTIPSKKFQIAAAQKKARLLVGNEVSLEDIEAINSEISAAPAIISDPEIISTDVQEGILSTGTAAEIRGYGKAEAEKAAEEKHQRAMDLMEAQAALRPQGGIKNPGARGIKDLSTDPKQEVRNERKGKPKRGKGK